MSTDAKFYSATVSLSDVGTVEVRAVRSDDKDRLRDHFERLTRRTVYFRFLESKTELTDDELAFYTELDFDTHVGLVAIDPESGSDRIVGVGRYVIEDEGDRSRARVAFAVADLYQGRGIGTGLLKHLARIASLAGIRTFEGRVLSANRRTLDFFEKAGFEVQRTGESDGAINFTIPIG